jgi:hypothetical protein
MYYWERGQLTYTEKQFADLEIAMEYIDNSKKHSAKIFDSEGRVIHTATHQNSKQESYADGTYA